MTQKSLTALAPPLSWNQNGFSTFIVWFPSISSSTSLMSSSSLAFFFVRSWFSEPRESLSSSSVWICCFSSFSSLFSVYNQNNTKWKTVLHEHTPLNESKVSVEAAYTKLKAPAIRPASKSASQQNVRLVVALHFQTLPWPGRWEFGIRSMHNLSKRWLDLHISFTLKTTIKLAHITLFSPSLLTMVYL